LWHALTNEWEALILFERQVHLPTIKLRLPWWRLKCCAILFSLVRVCGWQNNSWAIIDFFSFPLSFLSLCLNFHTSPSKKPIVSSSLYFNQFWSSFFGFWLLFVLLLILFEGFCSSSFFIFFTKHFISLNFFYLILSSLFWLLFFFIIFLIIVF
jgi:hypothetical protein